MYFNSIAYAIFLPIVFIVYWLIQYRTVKIQNAFILFSSYVFYGWWDPRFLSLILISSVTDYIIGIKLENEIEYTPFSFPDKPINNTYWPIFKLLNIAHDIKLGS